jgi:hypothetical protein
VEASVAATLGSADGAAAGWSSFGEQPIIGEVEIRTAAASINGSDLPFGLVSNVIIFPVLWRASNN